MVCPSSPEYLRAAASITEQLARRYGCHPAVVLWHVHNEYGAPVSACYCDDLRCGLPRLAARPLRHSGRTERGLGHRLLGPAIRRLGRDRRAPGGADASATRPSGWTSHASPPTQLLAMLHRRARRAPPARPRRPGHHQLHGAPTAIRWTTGRGAGRWTSSPTTTTSSPNAPTTTSCLRWTPTSPAPSPVARRGC